MSRPVISYDDITLPYSQVPARPNPPKKRKRNNHKKPAPAPPVPHWDDPTLADEDEDSRELTHDEIWDDSALIEAWNAAMEEYEAYHGPDKDAWKTQPPEHKSPLWYNIPPKKSPTKNKSKSTTTQPTAVATVDDEADSKPIDFDTFVPTHDPSLSTPAVEEEAYTTPLTHLSNISQDEVFERAVQASYWTGYWTAVYHHHRQNETKPDISEEAEAEQDIGSSSEGEQEEFVSTQR